MNKGLLGDFQKRVDNIAIISKDKNSLNTAVVDFAKGQNIELKSKKLESKILEYLLNKQNLNEKIDIKDFDLLIWYQMMWKYEEFMKSSNDKLASNKDKESQHMIQIQALLKEYW